MISSGCIYLLPVRWDFKQGTTAPIMIRDRSLDVSSQRRLHNFTATDITKMPDVDVLIQESIVMVDCTHVLHPGDMHCGGKSEERSWSLSLTYRHVVTPAFLLHGGLTACAVSE